MLDYDVPTGVTAKVPQDLHDIDYTTSDESQFCEECSNTSSENTYITLQDLQAMKKMVHDIYRFPDLFFVHSPMYVQSALSDDAQMIQPGPDTSTSCQDDNSIMAPHRQQQIYCQDFSSIGKFHQSRRSSPNKFCRRRVRSSPASLPEFKGRKLISPAVLAKLPRCHFEVMVLRSINQTRLTEMGSLSTFVKQ